MDHVRDHFWKRFVARYRCQNLSASNRLGARPPPNIHGHGVDKFFVNFRLEPAKAKVRGFMVATTSRATGPVNGEGINARAHFLVKSLRERQGATLRFDQGQIAIVGADTGNKSTLKRGRTRRELLEQRFPEKLHEAISRHMRNDGVLPGSEADFALAVNIRETREFVRLIRVDPAYGNAEATRHQPGLLLRGSPNVVGMMRTPHVPPLNCEFVPHACGKLRS